MDKEQAFEAWWVPYLTCISGMGIYRANFRDAFMAGHDMASAVLSAHGVGVVENVECHICGEEKAISEHLIRTVCTNPKCRAIYYTSPAAPAQGKGEG